VDGLTVALDAGRAACADSAAAFLRAVDGMREYELLGASRCHGWTRLDVVTHMIAGWHEMLEGLVSPVDSEASVDAASYWSTFATEYATDDPVPTLMSQRRRTAAYARPASAIGQLHDVGEATLRGIDSFDGRPCTGHAVWTQSANQAGVSYAPSSEKRSSHAVLSRGGRRSSRQTAISKSRLTVT
jgi:hypothetical protein